MNARTNAVVEEAGGVVLGGGRPAQEVQRLSPDGEQQCGRQHRIDLHLKGFDVLGKVRRRRADLLAVIDEPGLDGFCGVVVDHDIDGRLRRDVVVCAWRRVIDEGDEGVLRAIQKRAGVERFEVDFEQIDERAVLLVGDIAAVEDVSLVDPGVGGDPAQGERAGETVRIWVVVADDVEFAALGKHLVEVVDGTHWFVFRCYTLRNR